MEAETNAEVIGVVLGSSVLIKSEQCVDIMVLDERRPPKDCSLCSIWRYPLSGLTQRSETSLQWPGRV